MDDRQECCGGSCHTPGMEIQAAPKALFQVGQRVRHKPLEGTITTVKGSYTEITLDRGETWSIETYPDPEYPFEPEWEVI